jgi:uncharacterized DUF497 family protein
MKALRFDWDPNKNAINQKKHGVGFEEAKTCFEDDYAEVFEDAEHSKDEDRAILLGMSALLKTLVVVYTERTLDENNQIVNRIISARKATKKEFQYYWSRRPTVR